MIEKLTGLFSAYKIYVYVGLAIFAAVAILAYGKIQYIKGQAECKQSYAEEQVRYQRKVRDEERKAAKAAMDKEAKVSKQLGDLRASKDKATDEARRLATESGRGDACNLSPAEMDYWARAVEGT
jgi:predicted Holliday junction resolvase-like endonuclease